MKNTYLLFVAILFTATGILAQEETSILFLGNSYTNGNSTNTDNVDGTNYSVPHDFKQLALAEGHNVHVEMHCPNGQDGAVSGQINDATTTSLINSRNWDYIYIQDNQGDYVQDLGQIQQSTADNNITLYNRIKDNNSCTRVIYFAGQALKGGLSAYSGWEDDNTVECNIRVYNNIRYLNDNAGFNEIVLPSGLGWNQYINDGYSEDYLFASDGYHATDEGTFIHACFVYVTVFKESLSNNPYSGGVTNATRAQYIKDMAFDVVTETPTFTETHLSDFSPEISYANPTLSTADVWSGYQWFNNNTNLLSGATSNSYNISETEDYYVLVTNSEGCKFRSFELNCTYSANGDPTAQFSGTPTIIHEGETVTFTDMSGDGGYAISNWQWTFTGGTPSSYTGQNPPTITYNTAGTYEVSLTVTNSQDSDTETKTGYITVLAMGDAFSLDFEACTDYSQDFTPWSTVCIDGKNTYSSSDFDFTGEGTAFGFMAFNPVDAALSTPIANTHAGNRCGISSCPSDQSQTNHWLISDKVNLGTGAQFKFWALTLKDTWGLEDYNVLVSTTDNNPNSFTAIASGETAPASWTQRSYDLSAYVGQDIYVAIQHTSTDKFMLWVDDIEILGGTTSVEVTENKNIEIYPNPAKNNINITNSNNSIINIIDINGKTVLSDNVNSDMYNIDISKLNQGTYFVRIISEKVVTIKKLIKE